MNRAGFAQTVRASSRMTSLLRALRKSIFQEKSLKLKQH